MSAPERRRILHLIPSLSGGGAERQLVMLAAEQARRGYDVHVAIRRGGAHESELMTRSLAVHALGDHRGVNPRLMMRITALLSETKPHIVQTWLPQMDILGGLCALRRRVPWILCERASAAAFTRPRLPYWLRRRLGVWAQAIVANSNAGSEYWRAAGAHGCVCVVPNAVDATAIRAATSQKTECARSGDDDLLLVVGRLDHQKAVEIILQALAQIGAAAAFRVLIIGEGPERSSLQASAQRLGLGQHVSWLSYQRDWWGWLKGAAALVSMSRFEGHPNVVLESIAGGCPLIVSDIPEHREFLDERSAVMVRSEDSSALAQAILAVLADPHGARRRAVAARERIAGLTIEASAAAYGRVYDTLLRESR